MRPIWNCSSSSASRFRPQHHKDPANSPEVPPLVQRDNMISYFRILSELTFHEDDTTNLGRELHDLGCLALDVFALDLQRINEMFVDSIPIRFAWNRSDDSPRVPLYLRIDPNSNSLRLCAVPNKPLLNSRSCPKPNSLRLYAIPHRMLLGLRVDSIRGMVEDTALYPS